MAGFQELSDAERSSLRAWQSLVTALPAMSALLDDTGRILVSNPSWHEAFGDSAPTGKDFLAWSRGGAVGQKVAAVLRGDAEAERIEQRFQRKGRLGWFDCEIRAVIDPETGRRHALICFTDVTEGRRANLRALDAARRVRLMADMLPAMVLYVDSAGVYRFVNRQYEAFVGRPAKEIVGCKVKDVLGPAKYEQLRHHFERALSGEKVEFEDFFESTGQWFYSRLVPHFDTAGRFIGYFALVTDISERKTSELALIEASSTADRASQAKSDFLAAMSHELRTPLNAIIGFSEVMRDGIYGPVGNPRYVEYAGDIHSAGEFLLTLINDVLDLSKVEAGRLELREQPIDMAALIRAAVNLVEQRASRAQVTLVTHLAPDLPPILGDERLLRQAVLNLVSNAVKFTPSGGRVLIEANCGRQGGLVVEIRDTGTGIEPEEIERLFTPFSQGRAALRVAERGTGLGLPLARKFVEAHGGTLQLESRPGLGTTARIALLADRELPLALAPEARLR